MASVIERFLRYVKVNTTSDGQSGKTPSSQGQKFFADQLAKELRDIGMDEVEVDHFGYVMATLPSNTRASIPVVGLIAHLDTSPDFPGDRVVPQICYNYQGDNIVLNGSSGCVLSAKEFPELLKYIGQDIITSDGNTLLGADNKAGIAEIITAVEYLLLHPEITHGKIRICFTPDEEIGEGADHFDVLKFGADFAYTIDGGEIGELEYENFNAAKATVTFLGRNVHPGYAKGKMVNSMLLAYEFMSLMPAGEVPEQTGDYEGFYHLNVIQGDVEKTELHYIIRDFDRRSFEKRKLFIQSAVDQMASRYGAHSVLLDLKDQYYNMKEKIEPVLHVVDLARKAMLMEGVQPLVRPIRGGTDGARLSFMGLPTPNLFAGGHNFHGRYEFIPVQSMEKAVDVIVRLVRMAAE